MNILGYPVKRMGRASKIGFPTINIKSEGEINLPYGVYSAEVEIGGKDYFCLIHYGDSPTFDDKEKIFELHLLNISDKSFVINNKLIKVEIKKFLRPIKKFKTKEELIKQIKKDIKKAKD